MTSGAARSVGRGHVEGCGFSNCDYSEEVTKKPELKKGRGRRGGGAVAVRADERSSNAAGLQKRGGRREENTTAKSKAAPVFIVRKRGPRRFIGIDKGRDIVIVCAAPIAVVVRAKRV